MRHLISGLVAAIAVTAAAPAMACGFTPCAAPVYAAPVQTYTYSGCNPCGGWAHERLADPEVQYGAQQDYGSQYYYVNQGPTYTGPGDWAPRPTYRESAVYGYRPYHHYRPWYPRSSYYHAPRFHHYGAPHYGYAPRHAYMPRYAPESYHYGHRVLRRYY